MEMRLMFLPWWRNLTKALSLLSRSNKRSRLPRCPAGRLPRLEPLEPRVVPATFVVTNTTDNTSTGSLRWAINQNNTTTGQTNIIHFNIAGPASIAIGSQLPQITNPVILDGTSQPGWTARPLIELNGT